MSSDNSNDDNKIIEFDLTEETKRDELVTRMYRQGNLVFAIIEDKYSFFIEVKAGKLSEVAKKFREVIQAELPIQKKDASKEDIMRIASNISGEITNNIQKLQDIGTNDVKVEKSKNKKGGMFSVDDIWDEEGRIDERKLTSDKLIALRTSRVGLFANKVTKTKLRENDPLLQNLKAFANLSEDVRYQKYQEIENVQFDDRAQTLYEAIVFRSPNTVSENNSADDKLTTDIADNDSDTPGDKSKNDTPKDIFLEDANRYNTRFVSFDADLEEFKESEYIIKNNRVIFPMPSAGTPAMPYEFYNIDYMNLFYKNEVANDKTTIVTLFKEMLAIVMHYNKISLANAIIWSASIVMTYFIDKFSVTPYFAVVGIPGSGKSTLLITVKWTGYRSTSMTNPNAAQAVRVFGNVEEGQLTLVADEVDKIDTDGDFMAMIKNGNQKDGQHQKVNEITRLLDYFFTYCTKFLGMEKAPAEWATMAWYERTILNKSKKTVMKSNDPNVKDLMMTIGLSNQTKEMKMAILKWRKKAMIYRMTHYNDPIQHIDIGIGGREKEIAYPILSLFYETELQDKVTWSMQQMLDQMNHIKRNSLPAVLCVKIAKYMYDHREQNLNTLRIKDFWDDLTIDENFGSFMRDISGKKKWIETLDYGSVTSTMIGQEFKNNFKTDGGKHTKQGKIWTFDLDVIIARLEMYQVSKDRLKLNLDKENLISGDQSDRSDHFLEGIADNILNFKVSETEQIETDISTLEDKFETINKLIIKLEPELETKPKTDNGQDNNKKSPIQVKQEIKSQESN